MERDVLHIWKNPPSMGDNITWCVFLQDREVDYYLREVKLFHIKNWTKVLQRVESGEWDKSILENVARITKIPKLELDIRLELLNQISIPLWVNHPGGYDGTDYGLELFNGMHGCRLAWWEEGPAEWKPLIGWYHETLAFFAHNLNSSSPQPDNKY